MDRTWADGTKSQFLPRLAASLGPGMELPMNRTIGLEACKMRACQLYKLQGGTQQTAILTRKLVLRCPGIFLIRFGGLGEGDKNSWARIQ